MSLPITYLFVPGNRPERFSKALASAADAVVFDLEDAVAISDKASARAAIASWVTEHPEAAKSIVLRINDAHSTQFAADLELINTTRIQHIILPKAESAEQIQQVLAGTNSNQVIIPLIETAVGVLNLDSIAKATNVQRLAFGTLDYAVDLDLSGHELGLVYPSTLMALVSRRAGIGSPIAGVTPSIDDAERIQADVEFARAFGFGAKLCIHPKQVTIVQNTYLPSVEEQAWAKRVLASVDAQGSAAQLDGKMIDRPVVLRAQAIVARASKHSL